MTLVYQFSCRHEAAPVSTQGDTGNKSQLFFVIALGQNIDFFGPDLTSLADNIAIGGAVEIYGDFVAHFGFGKGVKNGQGIAGPIKLGEGRMTEDNGVTKSA